MHEISNNVVCATSKASDQPAHTRIREIYPTEHQFNKANSYNTEAPFLDLDLSITNGILSSKVYDKRNYFSFEKHVLVNLPFLNGDVLEDFESASPYFCTFLTNRICNRRF